MELQRPWWQRLFGAVLLAGLATATDVVYVTELDIFSLLAPCAADAVSYNVAEQTYNSQCADDQTALQKCICSNTAEFQEVSSSISSDVAVNCGTSAKDDFKSASIVMDQYCNPDKTVTFSTPTKHTVNAYITDLAQLTYLPPCAQSAVSGAVMGDNLEKCPADAYLFAPCVCSKDGFPEAISETMSRYVRSSCSNNEDVTSAYNFFDEYCAMNKGTTRFARPSPPPGDMSYYITALTQFKSLRGCAQTGLASAVLAQTFDFCGSGPQALASCACLKFGMTKRISSTLTSNVKYYCDNTAINDVTSAIDVFEFYCSAAKNKVVATVSESIKETFAITDTDNGAISSPTAKEGDRTGGTRETNQASGEPKSGDKKKGGTNQTAVIAASVLGGIVAIVAVVGAVFFFKRKKRNQQSNTQHPANGSSDDLASKPGATGYVQELHSTEYHQRTELAGGPGSAVMYSELSSSQAPRSELHDGSNSGYTTPYNRSPHQQTASPYGPPYAPYNQNQTVYEAPGSTGTASHS